MKNAMWAVRKAVNPLRSHGHCSGTLRTCSGALELLSNNLEHGNPNPEANRITPKSCFTFTPTRFSHYPSPPIVVSTRNLSSQARTEHSEDEDTFSELETSSVGEEKVAKDAGEELVSEPELSDNESVDDLSEAPHSELYISEGEAGIANDKKSRTRGSTISPLFKAIMEAPRQSIQGTMANWVGEGKPLGRSEISLAMLNFRRRKLFWRALQLAEWVEANKPMTLTERDYASHLDLIAKVHGIPRAEKYIEKIPSAFRGEVIYRTLLANCASSDNARKAEEVFNKMRDMDFSLTSFSFNQLIVLYKKLDRKKIADVLLMMEKENVKPSLFTYKLLIDAKGRTNDIDGMEQVIESMKSEGLEPDLTMQAMVARYYIFAGLNDKAETVLKEIEGEGIKQNRGACRILLPLYASLGKVDEVGRIWKVCELAPRLDEYLAAIEAWGKLGQIENAEEVFEKMSKSWKRLTSKYYTALLKVYAHHKMLDKGKDLVKRMSDNGCRIGPMTWDALVKLYVEAGEVEKADSILSKAVLQSPIKPLYCSYMTILDKYAKKGNVHSAEKIFNKMRQGGYVARVTMYQALLQSYINAKTPAYGFRERLKADNVFPNKAMATQLALVDAFRKTAISELLE